MQTFDAKGSALTPILFIKIYGIARKLAPPRFLTMRLNKDRYDELYKCAEPEESIQLGSTAGPLGTVVMRVHCVRPPLGVADGIAIKIDPKMEPDELVFERHGQIEFVVENLAHNASD